MSNNKYFAFISYKYEDAELAMWLHHEIENYRLPSALNDKTDIPHKFSPVFRDADELKVGSLPQQLYEALSQSTNLIVVCSPLSAQSEWVNQEISNFVEIGRQKGIDNVKHIFPFIVDGKPHAKDKSQECYPPALLDICRTNEIYGSDVNDYGRDKAFVKIMAGMLQNVDFDELWNRYEKQKAEEERIKREERNRFLALQSRFVAEKAKDIKNDSCLQQLLALEILPKDLSNPERPYTIEAECLLRQASAKRQLLLKGHIVHVDAVSFNSDGSKVVSISDDFTIRVWDTLTGQVLKILQSDVFGSSSVMFSPDDTVIIACYFDGEVRIWDAKTYDLLDGYNINDFSDDLHLHSVHAMAMSPNCSLMAFASGCDLLIVNLLTIDKICQKTDSIASMSFNHEGSQLVAMTNKGLKIWDLAEGEEGNIKFNDNVSIQHMQAMFSPDDKYLAVVCDGLIGCIDIRGEQRVQILEEKKHIYVSVAFCEDSEHIIVASEEGVITVWNIHTKEHYVVDYVNAESVSLMIYNALTMQAALVVDKNDIVIRQLAQQYIHKLSIPQFEETGSICYSPDGKYIACGSSELYDGRIVILETSTQSVVRSLVGHKDTVLSVVYSSDGRFLLSSSCDETIRIWDAHSGENLFLLESETAVGKSATFVCAVFSPDEKNVAACTSRGDIIIWDYISDKIISIFEHSSIFQIFSIAYNVDGTKIASTSLDQDIKIWSVGENRLLATLKEHTDIVRVVAYSPDGKYLFSASQDKTIICRDAETLNIQWRKNVFGSRVFQASYSHDGRYIVVVLEDVGSVIVLDSNSGETVYVIDCFNYFPRCAVFSPNNESIAVTTANSIYVYDFQDMHQLINNVKKQVQVRQLTSEEKRRYYLE